MRIAICDDLHKDLKILLQLVTEYLKEHKLEADIRQFSNSDDLILTIKKSHFHLYILDIVMPFFSGLELGQEIRRLDCEAQIIYTTTEPQFALQAFSANPINYLLKPVDKKQFFDTLTLAISKLDLSGEQTIAIKTVAGMRIVKFTDIAYCEYQNHTAIYTLISNEIIISRTFKGNFSEYIAPLLGDRRFLQPHVSFVVNMGYVERFYKDSFILRSGAIIPISSKQYAIVRDNFMDYITS